MLPEGGDALLFPLLLILYHGGRLVLMHIPLLLDAVKVGVGLLLLLLLLLLLPRDGNGPSICFLVQGRNVLQ